MPTSSILPGPRGVLRADGADLDRFMLIVDEVLVPTVSS